MRTFLENVGAASDSLVGARLARAFAVVYAAGVLGVEAGVLPWRKGRVLWAVRRCFRAARVQLRDDALLATEGLSRFWREAGKERVPWPERGKKPDPAAARAEVFRRKRRTDIEYAIVPAALERWLPDGRQRELVLQALRRDGRLRVDGASDTRQPRVLEPTDRRRYYLVRRSLKAATTKLAKKNLNRSNGPKRRPA